MDQADTLRKLMGSQGSKRSIAGTQVVTVTSSDLDKDKSVLTLNLAAQFSKDDWKTVVLDSGVGDVSLEQLYSLKPKASMEAVESGRAGVREAVVEMAENLWVFPVSSLKTNSKSVAQLLAKSHLDPDIVFVDTGVGVHAGNLGFFKPSFHNLMVLNSSEESYSNALEQIRTLRRYRGVTWVGIAVNQVTDGMMGYQVFKKLSDYVTRFMDVKIDYLGHLPVDQKVKQSVMEQGILLKLYPEAASIPCLGLVAKRLKSLRLDDEGFGSGKRAPSDRWFGDEPASAFWNDLLGEVMIWR